MVRLARTQKDVRVVNDQRGCPTAASALARSLAGQMIARIVHPDFKDWGTYHFCGTPACTWHNFAAAIFEEMALQGQKAPRLHAIPTAAYPTLARRPANSALELWLRLRPAWHGIRSCHVSMAHGSGRNRAADHGLMDLSAAPIGGHVLVGQPQGGGGRSGLPEHIDGHAATRIPIAADAQP